MEKEKKSKNSSTTVIAILAVLLVVAISSTAYFYMKSSKASTESGDKTTVITDKENKNVNSEKLVVQNGFDASKSLNTTGKTYTLTYHDYSRGMDLRLDSTKKKMEVYLAACRFNFTYSLGWMTMNEETCAASGEREFEKRGELSFDQEVSDYIIGGFGQEQSHDTILFLMKDGTVEYIPIKKGYTGVLTENVKSFGKISGVKDVIKLYQVSAGSYVTVLAQQADGSFYDLNESLSSMNAWS